MYRIITELWANHSFHDGMLIDMKSKQIKNTIRMNIYIVSYISFGTYMGSYMFIKNSWIVLCHDYAIDVSQYDGHIKSNSIWIVPNHTVSL